MGASWWRCKCGRMAKGDRCVEDVYDRLIEILTDQFPVPGFRFRCTVLTEVVYLASNADTGLTGRVASVPGRRRAT